MKKEFGLGQNKRIIWILISVIIALSLLLIYLLAIRPAISGYIINAQNQGYAAAVISIMQQAVTCQTVPLTFGNQTINLIAIECLQQPQVNLQG